MTMAIFFFFFLAVSEKKEFLYAHIVQKGHIHQSHAYWRIKISWTVFEKGHPRNIPVKLFQNLTGGSRGEDF